MAGGDAQSLADADPRYTLENSVATEVQARSHAIKAAPEFPRARGIWRRISGRGGALRTPPLDSDREGVATISPLNSDGIFSMALTHKFELA
eukprot:6208177-Pleurochrysis_carterae.AAC.2